jgi:glutaredoxin
MTPRRIVMYSRPGCEDSDAARAFLVRHNLRFEEINIDENPQALRFVMSVNEGKQRTPTFEVDGRIFHCSPYDERRLAYNLGFTFAGSGPSAPSGSR